MGRKGPMSLRFSLGLLVIVASLCLVGCQTTPASSVDSSPATKAVIASAGNGTTVIYLPAGKGGVQTLSTSSAATCDKCAADAAAYFQGATLEPKCPQCGAIRTAALGHQ